MNQSNGEIEHFGNTRLIPSGWLKLTKTEAEEFERLPNDVRLEHYMKAHRTDKCGFCGCFVGNHSLRKFKECAATELKKFDDAVAGQRSDTTMCDIFDSLPRKRLQDELLAARLAATFDSTK